VGLPCPGRVPGAIAVVRVRGLCAVRKHAIGLRDRFGGRVPPRNGHDHGLAPSGAEVNRHTAGLNSNLHSASCPRRVPGRPLRAASGSAAVQGPAHAATGMPHDTGMLRSAAGSQPEPQPLNTVSAVIPRMVHIRLAA
jgi:hypothetical protein